MLHCRARPRSSGGAGVRLGAAWGSGPAAPGVGQATEGGAEGPAERGVTTSKAGRRRRAVGGAGGRGVSATSASSSVVSISPSSGGGRTDLGPGVVGSFCTRLGRAGHTSRWHGGHHHSWRSGEVRWSSSRRQGAGFLVWGRLGWGSGVLPSCSVDHRWDIRDDHICRQVRCGHISDSCYNRWFCWRSERS